MKVLILDMVHGGEILAEDLLNMGNEVHCVDVYGIAKDDIKEIMRDMGANVHTSVPPGHYDLLLMPVHCPDSFLDGVSWNERKTFHEAVGELIDGGSRIEVTGVKGKTSLCYLLAHILQLDGRRIFLHTSRGQGNFVDGSHLIERKVSIAPTSLLRLPKDNDLVIAEVSLGGSGKADIAIITNLAEDYGIAQNSKRASDAKASIFSKEGKNIVKMTEMGIWSKYRDDLIGYGDRVTLVDPPKLGEPLRLLMDYSGEHEAVLGPTYLHGQYTDAMNAALKICSIMEIPIEQVIAGLESFEGVPGRGEVHRTGEGWEIIDRNPGISQISVRNLIGSLETMGILEDAHFILDPVNRKVCDKLDIDEIRNAITDKGATFSLSTDDGYTERPITVRLIKEGYQ